MIKWYMDFNKVMFGFMAFGCTISINIVTILNFSKPAITNPDKWITVDGWFIVPTLGFCILLISWFMND